MVLANLAHHVDIDLLRQAHQRTRKDGAVGTDGQTGRVYAEDLEANLQKLWERLRTGIYRAPPVRRVHIPKVMGHRPGRLESRPTRIKSYSELTRW
jgi:retron-type reverse transcriptase